MPLGIRPTVDFVFKLLFGSEENKDLLIHLLNSVLQPEFPIEQVEIQNPYNEKQFLKDKLSIVDVKARDSRGDWYVIEMQKTLPEELSNRLIYYTSKLYSGQMHAGQSYGELHPATCICFLNDSVFRQSTAGHFRFELYDPSQQQRLSDQFQIHLIELPKFAVGEADLDAASFLDRWVYFMKVSHRLDAQQLRRLLPGAPFDKATEVLEMISSDPKLRQIYEDRVKAERDRLSMIKDTRAQALAEGRAEGERIGEERGKAEGEKIGEQRGKIEGKLVGQIQTLQEILGEDLTSESELSEKSVTELERLVSVLREQIRNRG